MSTKNNDWEDKSRFQIRNTNPDLPAASKVESSSGKDEESPTDHSQDMHRENINTLDIPDVHANINLSNHNRPEDHLEDQNIHMSPPPNTETKEASRTPTRTPASASAVNNQSRIFIRARETEIDHKPEKYGSLLTTFLIRLFRLDVYGKKNLTKRALYAMEKASIILGIIFIFDLALWFILLNMIFNSGALILSGYSPLAGILALCMASVSIIFESSIVSTDFSVKGPTTIFAILSRVIIVIFAALVTAQPFHILVFDSEIEQRARIEQGIAKGVVMAQNLQKNDPEKVVQNLCSFDGKGKEDELVLVEHGKQVDEASQNVADVNTAIHALQFTKKHYLGSYKTPKGATINYTTRTWKGGGTDMSWYIRWGSGKSCLAYHTGTKGGFKSEAAAKSVCRERVRYTKARIKELESELATLQSKLAGAKGLRQNIKEDSPITISGDLEDACTQEANTYSDWLDTILPVYAEKLNTSDLGQDSFSLPHCTEKGLEKLEAQRNSRIEEFKIEEERKTAPFAANSQAAIAIQSKFETRRNIVNTLYENKVDACTTWEFNYASPPFFSRLRILSRIINGIPPQWPEREYSEIECDIMLDIFKYPTPNEGICASTVQHSTTSGLKALQDQRKNEANALWWMYMFVSFIGIFVPLISLVFKIVAPKELQDYYSSENQRQQDPYLLDDIMKRNRE